MSYPNGIMVLSKEKKRGKMSREEKIETFWDYLGYAVLFLIMLGQVVISLNVIYSNLVYLICNIISLARTFALVRPKSDKVKDIACFALTAGILLMQLF